MKINTTPIAATRSGHHPRFANNPHHSTSIRRTASYLATPEAGWAPLAANGLSLTRYTGIEALEEPSSDWYTYEHSTDYRSSQLAFLQVLQSADGNKLFDVLQRNPYSVDTLLQLAEMSTQQGDLGMQKYILSFYFKRLTIYSFTRGCINISIEGTARYLRSSADVISRWIVPTLVCQGRESKFLPRRSTKGSLAGQARHMANSNGVV